MHRNSIIYSGIRFWLRLTFRFYYREIQIIGNPNAVPADYPVIFAPNHQNAFVDAIIVHYAANRQSVSLTRSDVFANPKLSSIFRHLKMIPVYRRRDGVDVVAQNKIVFDQCADILDKKGSLLIFPEGNHGAEFKLRTLQKGFARIGFQAEDQANFNLGVHVVPVSINYEQHDLFNGALMIAYAEPIRLDSYESEFREHPQQAYKALKKELEIKIKNGLVHIPVKGSFYETLNSIRRLFFDRKTDWQSQITMMQSAAQNISQEGFEAELQKAWEDYHSYTLQVKAPVKKSPRQKPSIATIILGFLWILIQIPFAVPGYLVHRMSFTICENIVRRNFVDPQFHNGVKLILSQVISLVFYAIIAFIICLIGFPLWLAILGVLLIFLSGIFAKFALLNIQDFHKKWQFYRLTDEQFEIQQEKQFTVLKLLQAT